ncbi:MAG: hypothetical protein KAI66_21830, partial [Lentisphaeria bacterium]|nr:hypothetical protein [Lentisphaeria bacterium]
LHCKGSGKDSWPGIYVDAKNDMDWTGRELVFDVFVAGDKSSHLNLRLDGADGIFVFSSVTLKPGANQDVTISVETMAGGKVDITRIKSVFLYYSCPREDQTFFLDHVRLRVPDAGDAGRIASFESDEDNPFVASNCTVERTNAVKTHGEFGLRVQVPGNDKDTWPGLSWHPKNGDWSKHESLLMDVFVEGDAEMRLSCRIDTEDRANVFNSWPLKPGWNTDVMVNLKGQSKALNLNAVLHFYPYASIPRKTMAFVLDNLRFAKIPDPKTKLQRLAYVERNAGLPPNDEEKERGCQLFSRSYLHHVFPNSVPDNRLEKLALFVAQGEREPLTFSLHGLRDLRKVTINVAPASGPNGATLPPETWEIGRAECRDRRTFYSSTAYVADMPTYIEPLAEPLSVSSGTTQRFWLTLNTPPDARPGLYSGQISITIDGATTDLPLSVRVLPFSLPEAQGKFFGPYYRVWQNVPDKRQAIAADLADMRRQGMTSVGLCMGVGKSSYVVENGEVTFHFKDDTWFEWFMDAYRDLHFPSDLVLLSDSGREAARQVGKPGEAAYDQVYIRFHKALIAEAKQRGWPRMYVQPYDEPGYHDEAERLSNIAHLKLLKKAGIPTEQDGPPDSYFVGRAGPDSDMWTCNGRIVVPDVLEKARKAGKKVLVYNCDVEHYRPETGRWNYGLFCWRHRLDGSYNWEYRGGYGSLDSDFDGKYGVWVAHYLPGENTRGGPATGWEGFREGLDDYRYLMLLEELISRGGKTGGEAAKLAVEAEAFLAYLREHLDDAAGLRGRSTWAAKLSREEALKAGLSLRDKQARTVVVGPLRQPNGLDFSEYDAIRWMVARRALRLHQTLAGQVVPPGPSFRPQPVSQRFRILTDEIDSGTSQLYSRPTVSIPELAATPVIDGEIDGDPAWRQATTVSMVLSDGTGKSEMPTLVHLGRRDNTLYLGFVCHENRTRYMTAKVTTPEGNVWTDDCVEVFIDA